MFRKLIVVSALALVLGGCVSYGDPRYAGPAPVYRDGSYYSPPDQGYGDYYYAPESYGYYDYDYYDSYYSRGFGSSFGGSPWCSYGMRQSYYGYRNCPYGFGGGFGGGWGLSLFFGDRWGGWPYSNWPYDYRHRRHDRDDWHHGDRDHDGNDWHHGNRDDDGHDWHHDNRDHRDDDNDRRGRSNEPRPPSTQDRNPTDGRPRGDNGHEPGTRTRPIPGDRDGDSRYGRPGEPRPVSIERPRDGVPIPGRTWNDRNPEARQPRPQENDYMGRRPDLGNGLRDAPSRQPPPRYVPRTPTPLVSREPRAQPMPLPRGEPRPQFPVVRNEPRPQGPMVRNEPRPPSAVVREEPRPVRETPREAPAERSDRDDRDHDRRGSGGRPG